MYVSPSFSVMYSLMELSETGKSSGEIDVVMEPLVSSWGRRDGGCSSWVSVVLTGGGEGCPLKVSDD